MQLAETFSGIVGRLDTQVAKAAGWQADASFNCQQLRAIGLQPAVGGPHVQAHLQILKYNPYSRPSARSLMVLQVRERLGDCVL